MKSNADPHTVSCIYDAFFMATRQGNLEAVQSLHAGAGFDADVLGNEALHLHMQGKHLHVTRWLMNQLVSIAPEKIGHDGVSGWAKLVIWWARGGDASPTVASESTRPTTLVRFAEKMSKMSLDTKQIFKILDQLNVAFSDAAHCGRLDTVQAIQLGVGFSSATLCLEAFHLFSQGRHPHVARWLMDQSISVDPEIIALPNINSPDWTKFIAWWTRGSTNSYSE